MLSRASQAEADTDEVNDSRRTFLKVAGGAALVASNTMLAGCSGDEPDGSGDGGNGEDAETSAEGEPVNGGSFKMGLPSLGQGLGGTLHAMFTPSTSTTAKISFAWAERLVRFENGVPQPNLATEWGWVDDGSALEFTLREGVYFHPPYDDVEMTAEDWVRTFEEGLAPDVASSLYEQFGGTLVGEGIDATIDEVVSAPDKYTFRVEPPGGFNASLIYPFGTQYTYVVPGAVYDDVDQPKDAFGLPDPGPVGTGPFIYDSSSGTSSVTFTRNENYWHDTQPYLDEVTFEYSNNAQTRYTSLTTGDLDAIVGVPPNRAEELDQQDGYSSVVIDGIRVLRLAPNHTHWDPVSGYELGGGGGEAAENALKFKRGLAYALNYDPANEAVWDGLANINDCHIPSFFQHVQELEDEGRLKHYRQDKEKARQLFEESGYTPPLDGDWKFCTEQEVERNLTFMNIFTQQLGDMGFEPNGTPLIKPEGISLWRWNENAENPGSPPEDQDTFLYGHDRVIPDPDAWVGQVGYGPTSSNNRPHWIGDMETVRQANSEPDPEARKELWKDRIEECNKQIPEISTIWYPRVWGISDRVKNLYTSPWTTYDPRTAWIPEDQQ